MSDHRIPSARAALKDAQAMNARVRRGGEKALTPKDRKILEAEQAPGRNYAEAAEWLLSKYQRELAELEAARAGQGLLPFMKAASHISQVNDIIDSALFTARNKQTKREACENKQLAVIGGDLKISWTGVELRNYDDQLVLAHLVRIHSLTDTPIGELLKITKLGLLKEIGWPRQGHSFKRLFAAVDRLRSGAMTFESKALGRGRKENLITFFDYETDDGHDLPLWELRLNPNLAKWFNSGRYTLIEHDQYRQLPPMARKLADYAHRHKNPNPLPIETFLDWCGVNFSRERKALEAIQKAAKKLVDSGLVKKCWVAGEHIRFVR